MRRPILLLAVLVTAAACSSGSGAGTTATSAPSPATTVSSTDPPPATTTTAAPPPVTTAAEASFPDGEDLTRGATTRASRSLPDFPASAAIDGDPDTWWGAGEFPPQWIEVDLGGAATVTGIRLTVSQDPEGPATHVISAGGHEATLTESTADTDVLEFVPEEPWEGVRVLRIETTETPSWVAWREIEIVGIPGDTGEVSAGAPDVIFTGGPILTMSDPATVEAVAVTGETITAVGGAGDILATAGPATQVIDLGGRTLMPGIVDPHTHILNDAWRIDRDTLGGQELALESGITTFANLFTTSEFLDEMRSHEAAGELRARISLYLIATDNCGADAGDWWTEVAPTREPGEMLRIGGIKLFLDGGTCGGWAVSEEIEPGGGTGEVFLSTERVAEIVDRAAGIGHQVVIHAIGDVAILTALNAYLATTDPANPLRHRVDHLTMATDEVIGRFGESGAVGLVFGYYPICSEFPHTTFFEENVRRHQDLMAANPDSVVAWHGDDPWVGPVSPFEEMHNMVTRVEILDDGTECEPPPYLADRTFEVETVLRMMTIDAAYALHREDEVGSLESGKYADLIVITDDPTAVPLRAIHDIEVLATILGGRTEVCADPGVCP